jgi:hypothetical protein
MSCKRSWYQCLKYECDEPLSNFAFDFNLRRYTPGSTYDDVTRVTAFNAAEAAAEFLVNGSGGGAVGASEFGHTPKLFPHFRCKAPEFPHRPPKSLQIHPKIPQIRLLPLRDGGTGPLRVCLRRRGQVGFQGTR